MTRVLQVSIVGVVLALGLGVASSTAKADHWCYGPSYGYGGYSSYYSYGPTLSFSYGYPSYYGSYYSGYPRFYSSYPRSVYYAYPSYDHHHHHRYHRHRHGHSDIILHGRRAHVHW